MQFWKIAVAQTCQGAPQESCARSAKLDSKNGNGRRRGLWRRVVEVFYPSGEGRSGIPNLERRQPDDRHYNRVKRHCLCIQGVIVKTPRNLLAAAMGRRHTLLTAMVLHHLAAGTLFTGHRRISDRAGHCRGQERREQHSQCPEVCEDRSRLASILPT